MRLRFRKGAIYLARQFAHRVVIYRATHLLQNTAATVDDVHVRNPSLIVELPNHRTFPVEHYGISQLLLKGRAKHSSKGPRNHGDVGNAFDVDTLFISFVDLPDPRGQLFVSLATRNGHHGDL